MSRRNALLDHAMDLFPSPTDAFERVIERHRRRQRNRRIAAGAVGVAIAVMLALALATKGTFTNQHPATTPSVTPSAMGTVTVTNTGCRLDGAMNVAQGPFTLEVINDTSDTRTVELFRIANDARFARMLAFAGHTTPRLGSHNLWGFSEYGRSIETDLPSHDSVVMSGSLDGGTYGIYCLTGQPTERYRSSDLIGPIDVGSG